jgi:hypothetical protein
MDQENRSKYGYPDAQSKRWISFNSRIIRPQNSVEKGSVFSGWKILGLSRIIGKEWENLKPGLSALAFRG